MNKENIKEADCRCFKCHRLLRSAVVDTITWEAPGGAISFIDAGNFGSAISDSHYDGHRMQIVICDDCITKYRGVVREWDTPGYEEARDKRSAEALENIDIDALLKESDDDYE